MAVTEAHWKERIAFIEKLGLCVGALQSLRFQVDSECRARIDKLLEGIGDISVWRREGEHADRVPCPTSRASVSVEEWTAQDVIEQCMKSQVHVEDADMLAKSRNASLASPTSRLEEAERLAASRFETIGIYESRWLESEQREASLRASLAVAEARLKWLHIHARWTDKERRLSITFPMETVKFVTLNETIDAAIKSDSGITDAP